MNGLSFAQDANGNWGYKVGADAVIPFKSGIQTLLSTVQNTLHWYYGAAQSTQVPFNNSDYPDAYILIIANGYRSSDSPTWKINNVSVPNGASSQIIVNQNFASGSNYYNHLGIGLIKLKNIKKGSTVTVNHGGFNYEGRYIIMTLS